MEDSKTPIEIEAPTADQRYEVQARQITEYAEDGATEVQIISRLMAMGVPREKAEAQLPKILEATKGKRRKKLIVQKSVGAVLAVGGFGTGIYLLVGGVLFVWPFLIGALGTAILFGYLDSVWDVF